MDKNILSTCSWVTTENKDCKPKIDPDTRGCVLPLPPAMTCEPQPRFQHTITAGKLLGGKDAAVVYGGSSVTGELLNDMWLYPLYESFPTTKDCENCGWVIRTVIFAQIASIACSSKQITDFKKLLSIMGTGDDKSISAVQYEIVESPETSLNSGKKICKYDCKNDQWVFGELSTKSDGEKKAEPAVLLVLQTSIGGQGPNGGAKFIYNMIKRCIDASGCKELFKESLSEIPVDSPLKGSTLMRFETMQGEEVSKCYKGVINGNLQPDSNLGEDEKDVFLFNLFKKTCLQYREARVNAYNLDTGVECTDNCVRGFCQFENIDQYETT